MTTDFLRLSGPGAIATAAPLVTGADGWLLPAQGTMRSAGRTAYLVNIYPTVSHSFIRTEIAALEQQGIAVEQFTIRRSTAGFSSDEDRDEHARTEPLLEGNQLGLAIAVALRMCKQPRRTAGALVASLRMQGMRNVVRAVAYFAEAAALAERLERLQIKHVHAHFGSNPAAVARLASRMAPVTYSFTVHGPDEFDAPAALDLRGKIAEARFVAGVSSFGRAQLMRWSDTEHWSRIHVVRCAVAPQFLEPGPQQPSGAESSRLVCVARLDAQKGLPLLLEAVARLAPHRAFTLDIIGDGPFRSELEAQIKARNLSAHVKPLGWRAPRAVREAILSARALVLPSFAEGLPVVLMEALALGRPVVASAIAGVPELVDAANGWLIPAGSANALESAIAEVLDCSPERLRAMGEVGRARVQAMHHPDAIGSQLAGLLKPWL